MKGSWHFGFIFLLILAFGVLVNTWAYLGEAHVVRKELTGFPREIGVWKQVGVDQTFDSETMKILRASDYLLRDFRRDDGVIANFYVGYYASQRNGATFHSPLNCLPGSGWSMTEPTKVSINRPDGSAFTANKFVISNGDQKSIMIYWYQGRGREVASEYWGKIYTVIDSVRLRRSDGSMVRVTVPIGSSESVALRAAIDLSTQVSSALPEFVPD
jgi:EpsI family protein